MFVRTFKSRVIFNAVCLFILSAVFVFLFYNVYNSESINITFAVHPFNICEKYPDIWLKLKIFYIPTFLISSIICINHIYNFLFTKKKSTLNSIIPEDELSLFISKTDNDSSIILPSESLYQNILITGTIGSGKTSSAMYPFTRQLIKYKYDDEKHKLGMLILDVKGNYYLQVQKYANYYRRNDDLIIIELRWKYKI